MRKAAEWPIYVATLLITDLACVSGGALLAGWLRSLPALGSHTNEPFAAFIPILPLISLIFATQGLYDPKNLLGGTREYAAIFRACAYSLVAFVLLGFAARKQVSREWLALSWIFGTMLVGIARFALRRPAYWLRRLGYFTRRALVVGADAESVAVASQLGAAGSGVHVVGFLDDYAPVGSSVSNGLKVVGTPSALLRMAKRYHAQEAIVVPQALPWETLHNVMTEAVTDANGLRVHVSAGVYNLVTTGVRLSEPNHVPLLTLNKARLTPFESIIKVVLDYALGLVFLIIFAPAMLVTAVRLRRESPGRLIERRWVTGRGGRAFNQFSFRSSPRLTSAFVQKLPGLINVFRAELSLVGPRPLTPTAELARRPGVLTVRPGLTGPWRQAEDPAEQAVLDLYYVRSYSVWLDLQVLFGRLKFHLRRPRALGYQH